MNTERIKQLLEKYFEGETNLEEEEELRTFFRSEDIPAELKSYAGPFRHYEVLESSEASGEADAFAKIDFDTAGPSSAPTRSGGGFPANPAPVWTLRIAAGLILLLIGFSAGLLVNRLDKSGRQVAALQKEVQQMKSVLYGSYSDASASERISAVNLSARLPNRSGALDHEITQILIYTLDNDENINVRQAAADALFRFRDEPRIRKALVNSLSQQSEPLMQITLINMLVKIKATGAINEMQKLLMSNETQEIVKTRLKTGIAELKT